MRNNSLCYLAVLLLLQLAIQSGAHEIVEARQSLSEKNKDDSTLARLLVTEAAANNLRRRLEEEDGEAANDEEGEKESESKDEEGEKESESKDEEGDKKSESKDEEGEKESESKDEDGDKNSESKDEEEGTKDGKSSESGDEDEADGKKESKSSNDEAADGEKNSEEEKPAPELDDASKQYFESTKDSVVPETAAEAEGDADDSSDEAPVLQPPPSFYDLEDYSFETISMTSCQKIEFALAYLTSLEFDGSVVKKSKKKQEDSKFWSDVYIAEMVVLPTSLILAFFGSSLLMPASMLAAAGFGTFLVFHFIGSGLECKIKLGLSAVSAGACAALALKFVRFGLFTLGAFSTGLATYLFFDSFPAFDPGQNFFDAQGLVSDASYLSSVMKHSDISQAAWAITSVLALFTGVCIRVYEQASVEFLTAVLGGTGVGYAVHAHILVHGGSLPRSMVFVIAFLICVLGIRFQRRRRLGASAKAKESLPQFQANTPSNGASWNQLQKSIDTTNALLQAQGDDKTAEELAGLLNNFQNSVKERGKGD